MDRKSSWKTECPVVQTLERVGERWSILLLRELFRGAHRFDDLQASLGIAPNILSTRLTRLEMQASSRSTSTRSTPRGTATTSPSAARTSSRCCSCSSNSATSTSPPEGRRWPR